MLTLPFGYVAEPLTRLGLGVYRSAKHMHMAIVWGLSDGMATVSAAEAGVCNYHWVCEYGAHSSS
jgi:hypothetical protein